ncbi:hypothetical protein [Vannielia sp.]|nr:hypothetical protein [Vannielia sp.]MDF1872645.1 hypothetical protein [Vannielia sp.]
MIRILKILVILLVLGFVGLVGFAYLGDLSPRVEDIREPVELGID